MAGSQPLFPLPLGPGHPHTRGREYGAGTPGECKDMAIPRYTKEPIKIFEGSLAPYYRHLKGIRHKENINGALMVPPDS